MNAKVARELSTKVLDKHHYVIKIDAFITEAVEQGKFNTQVIVSKKDVYQLLAYYSNLGYHTSRFHSNDKDDIINLRWDCPV